MYNSNVGKSSFCSRGPAEFPALQLTFQQLYCKIHCRRIVKLAFRRLDLNQTHAEDFPTASYRHLSSVITTLLKNGQRKSFGDR